jgi:hypothetical protein
MPLLVVMMKMNTLQRDSLLKTSPLMISTRTERRKIEWNESMKDGKTMAELKFWFLLAFVLATIVILKRGERLLYVLLQFFHVISSFGR